MASTFRTLLPRRTFTAATILGAGQTVGVGMPIMINFSRPITDRAAVERALQIWSSKPVTGAWYWVTSKSVWFRPRHYWPAHTRVRFTAHLAGLQGAPGVYGRSDLTQHFRIGDSLIAVASAATHHMKVWWNGRLAGDWPVSTGRSGMDTPDGRYLSFAMGSPVDMNSASYGVGPGMPGYYNELVYDAVQFTFSGDYVHSAPWSVGEQGLVNVSHGCVNVAPGYAAWFYGHSVLGDPISVVGSPVAGTWGDGWTIYFLGWHKLLAGSATGQRGAGQPGRQPARGRLTSPSGTERSPGHETVPRGPDRSSSVTARVLRVVLPEQRLPALTGGDGGAFRLTGHASAVPVARARCRARWSRGRCPPGAGRSR